ncbi:hypothetical protein D9611_005605 [Ephemerocybe angulata]|uniref:Uncharacterized protein n=1 Tax=Ephemerocybe angulata TaxID=980116 RepID=A0A8H5BJ14_9AGAR|nr:hypothetical protein D9611_005605 [Tulosesus angulatus]
MAEVGGKVPQLGYLRAFPTILVLLHLCFTVVSATGVPKRVEDTWNAICAPFRNFIRPHDLPESVDLKPRQVLTKQRLLFTFACVEVFTWIGRTVFDFYLEDWSWSSICGVYALSWVYIATSVLKNPSLTPPYLFFAFSVSLASLGLFDLVYLLSSGFPVYSGLVLGNISLLALHGLFIAAAGSLPLKPYLPGLSVAGPDSTPSSKHTCPEDNVTLWSWSSFTFVEPIIRLASVRTLNEEDVWDLSPFFSHKNIFTKCLEYRTLHPDHTLLRFLIASNSLDLTLDVTLEMWTAVVGFVPAYALQKILSVLSDDTPESRRIAFFWAFITFLAHLSFAQLDLYQRWHTRRCYERTRGQIFCMLHYKSLKREEVSGHVSKEGEEDRADLGKIVNLMQGDTYAVAQRFWEFSGLFAAPVRIAIAMVFLYNVLGWSALMGVAIVGIVYILNYPLAKYNIFITRESWKAKDKRGSLVNEMLQNIRFLKFYGWEYDWSRKSEEARERELSWRVKGNIVDTLMSFIWTWMPSATALTCFLCYTLIAGERLTVSKAFTSIALFSSLQGPMVSLPGQIFAMLHAYVSMQRIEAFLEENEVPSWACSLERDADTPTVAPPTVQHTGFEGAKFEWDRKPSESDEPSRFCLGPLDIVFPEGKLAIVSGVTGSGKSALLDALLGEMHCISGKVLLDKSNHRVAYCAQNPWLEHATIRDNIIFGSPHPFDDERYRNVLHACALEQDLAILDAGDMTEIGEKGITLSGGQRARVALARALYSKARVMLLDDPLAAVDMHTAQHIVKNCFTGPLSEDRTVILVTHHISLCAPVATYLVELSEGKVLHQGNTDDLRSRGLLQTIVKKEEKPYVHPENVDTSPVVDESKGFAATRPLSNGKLIEVERRAEGRVSLRTYLTYIKAAGIFCWILTFILLIAIRLINIGAQVFLAAWGEAYEKGQAKSKPLSFFISSLSVKYPWEDLPPPDVDVKPWFLVYLYISTAGALSVLLYIALGYYASLRASRSLFIALLHRITRAPLRFFDTTPIGRILNRFTSDINTIDGALQGSARNCLSGILSFLASFTVMLVVVPAFAPWALFIAWLYIRLAPGYIKAARDLRRLESVALSPAFAGFDELLRGITHIRAFGMENRYQDGFYRKVDKFQSYDHVYWLVNNWLNWRYDCLGSLVVFAATIFALYQGVSNGSAAIVIVQAGIFAEASRQLVRVAAQLELDFNSVERVVEYLDVPQEAPAVVPDNRPPAYWPSNSGSLEVDSLEVKYAPHLPPVLKNLSFSVRPGEKIGVVGRTGSGKSTLALSLLRMIEPTSGSIIIDGLDISKLGLEDLRTRVTIVSQDVSLFSGTFRSNLDPLGKYTDEECFVALERCHMTTRLAFRPSEDEPTLLDMRVNKDSLSAGEKQLLALARAILRGTNIIIMDEATSQIDIELDDKIQKTIREETAGSIVITIAHRLKTVMDYDRILVLSDGEIVEFDSPAALLRKDGGAFRAICRQSSDWGSLSRIDSFPADE